LKIEKIISKFFYWIEVSKNDESILYVNVYGQEKLRGYIKCKICKLRQLD